MSYVLDFLTEEEMEISIELFGKPLYRKISNFWNKTNKRFGDNYSPKEKGGKFYLPKELRYIKEAKKLDKGQLRSENFYQRKISVNLIKYKNEKRWKNEYRIPIAYCLSRLKELKN